MSTEERLKDAWLDAELGLIIAQKNSRDFMEGVIARAQSGGIEIPATMFSDCGKLGGLISFLSDICGYLKEKE